MDEFNRWKDKYVVECTYSKDEIEHFGPCDRPSRYVRRNYSFKRKFEFTFGLLQHIDKYSNVELNNKVKQMFHIKDNMCNLQNKECKHKSVYHLVHVEIVDNPIRAIKNRLVEETNFSTIAEFEEAIKLGKRTKEELQDYKNKREQEKVKKLSNLFVKGRVK